MVPIPTSKDSSMRLSHIQHGYCLNAQGYRSDPFEVRKDINVLTVGCSNSLGWALEIEQRYSSLFCEAIKKETGKTVSDWNLALGGKSNDYMARIVLYATIQLKPDVYIVGFTGTGRREYWTCNDVCVDYVPSNFPDMVKKYHATQYYTHKQLHMLQSPKENYINFLKNYMCIESMLRDKTWYFLLPEMEEVPTEFLDMSRCLGRFPSVDKATDGLHPGVESHKIVAGRLFKRHFGTYI